jgi:glycolate oxidase
LSEFHKAVREVVPPERVLTDPAELGAYSCDGLVSYRARPGTVVLVESQDEIVHTVRQANRYGLAFVARGSGTGLSGGALPVEDGVLIVTSRMRTIIEVDPDNLCAVVEPGVINSDLSRAAEPFGLYYAPDPSSQIVCSLGGNVAENSGGAHCLKYGFTTNHVLGVEVVLPNGDVALLGGFSTESEGLDLRAAIVGSEGTLGVVSKIILRLSVRPESVRTLVADFDSVESAGDTVSAIIAAGVVPAALEMFDNLALVACEAATHAGYNPSAAAALLVEVDGATEEVEESYVTVLGLCESGGAKALRQAHTEAERSLMWRGRKAAFAAAGRLANGYIVQDGVVPRRVLATVLEEMGELARRHGLRVANVFHAGDGNLHPLVLFDPATPGDHERAERLATEILELCVAHGGSITGEHGVGVEKACAMLTMFRESDLLMMHRLRGVFDPRDLCNPGKAYPTPRLCGERPGVYRPSDLEEQGVIERW